MLNYPYVLFDLDGTLIDTNPIIIASYRYTFKQYLPDKHFSDQDIIDLIGPPLETIFKQLIPAVPFQELVDVYRAYYRQHEAQSHTLYPEVKETLDALHSMGAKMAIVTSKFKEGALPSVQHYGLEHYFEAFVGLDDVVQPKPNGEPVSLALRLLGAETGAKALMIGDNQSDILAGFNAGIDAAGIAWAIKGEDHLAQVNPTHMLKSMRDLIALVRGGQ